MVDQGGSLVNIRSPLAIAQAALEFMRDQMASEAVGKYARASVVERFSPDSVASAYEAQYASAIS